MLKVGGFKPRADPVPPATPTDADFKPEFVQKELDMRIGAKIRTFSVKNVLIVVGFPNAISNMLWGQRLILAIMGRHAPWT